MEMMLDKKQIWGTFLSEFKRGHKVAETAHNINNVFGPGTANQRTVQEWFKKFCKGDNNLEGEEHSGRPSEVDNDQLSASSKLILLQLYEKLPKNSTSTILGSFSIWSKLERWKSSVSVCLVNWLEIKKIVILKCHFLLLYATTETFLNRIVTSKKSGFYMTIGDDQLNGWTRNSKALPKAKLAPKRSWSLSGAASLLHYSFSEFWWNHYIWEVCQQINEVHWKLQCLQLAWVNRKGPILLQTTPNYTSPINVSKVAQTALQSSASSSIFMTSRQSNTTSSSILTTFCRENASTTSRTTQKMLSKKLTPKAQIFMLQK